MRDVTAATPKSEPNDFMTISRSTRPSLRCGDGSRRLPPAFSLIEMLVVISIIAVLAGLTVTGLKAYGGKKVRARVETELAAVQTAVEGYHAKKGFYPPDNAAKPAESTLYYELVGTVPLADNSGFETILAKEIITRANATTAFGVKAFMNSPDPEDAKSYYGNLRPSQFSEATLNGVKVKILGVSVKGPTGNFSPWHYNSSKPVHNPNGYDLWVEVLIGKETTVIGNWK